MGRISDGDYNAAKAILEKAGSMTAKKSHKKHGNASGSPEEHGKSLLAEARDEFQGTDKGGKVHKAGMTKAHYDAVHSAAKKMGVTRW